MARGSLAACSATCSASRATGSKPWGRPIGRAPTDPARRRAGDGGGAIDVTCQVIDRLGNLPADSLLVDVTSVKSEPLAHMLAVHRGPVLGLHPIFRAGRGEPRQAGDRLLSGDAIPSPASGCWNR